MKHRGSSLKKIHIEYVNELLRYNSIPCNEPHYHELKEYAKEASLLIQEIETALSMHSNLSELDLLYSRAFGIADDIFEASLLFAYLVFVLFCEAGVMDGLSLQRLLENTFRLDLEAMREYCIADDRLVNAIEFGSLQWCWLGAASGNAQC